MTPRALRLALAAALGATPLAAQDLPPPLGADTTLVPALARTRQRVLLETQARAWRVGDAQAREYVAGLTWTLRADRVEVRLRGTPLLFDTDSVDIGGMIPVSLRASFFPRSGDTLALLVSSPTAPASLDEAQVGAIGRVGVNTMDIASLQLGTPFTVGGRAAFSWPAGDVVLGVRAAVEWQPRPATPAFVIWRGTTLRGGAWLTGDLGPVRATVGGDVSWSSADTLAGNNMFPGGGAVTLELRTTTPLAGPGGAELDVGGAMAIPFDVKQRDQPNRLLPLGNFYVGSASVLVPLGKAALLPAVEVLGEQGTASLTLGPLTNTLQSSNWAGRGSLALLLPLGGRFDLAPEAGFATGSVDGTFTSVFVPPIRRGPTRSRTQQFSDDVRGWWVGVVLGASW